MANIVRRSEPASERQAAWNPFQVMRDLMHWDPLREMESLAGVERPFAPGFEVKETRDAFLFRADLPGIREQDLEISLVGNRLTVSGHREREPLQEGERSYVSERSYGEFNRTFVLPDDCDCQDVAADLRDGVLGIRVAKRPEAHARRIPIGRAAGSSQQVPRSVARGDSSVPNHIPPQSSGPHPTPPPVPTTNKGPQAKP